MRKGDVCDYKNVQKSGRASETCREGSSQVGVVCFFTFDEIFAQSLLKDSFTIVKGGDNKLRCGATLETGVLDYIRSGSRLIAICTSKKQMKAGALGPLCVSLSPCEETNGL